MKIIYFLLLLFFNLNCFSQVTKFNSYNENCDFSDRKLWVFSESSVDTVYLKLTFQNKISEKFLYSDLIRISYKKKKNEKYSEAYDIKPKEENINTQNQIHFLYEIMKSCLLKYEKFFYENNLEGIKKLESNYVTHYYYNLNIIIFHIHKK